MQQYLYNIFLVLVVCNSVSLKAAENSAAKRKLRFEGDKPLVRSRSASPHLNHSWNVRRDAMPPLKSALKVNTNVLPTSPAPLSAPIQGEVVHHGRQARRRFVKDDWNTLVLGHFIRRHKSIDKDKLKVIPYLIMTASSEDKGTYQFNELGVRTLDPEKIPFEHQYAKGFSNGTITFGWGKMDPADTCVIS